MRNLLPPAVLDAFLRVSRVASLLRHWRTHEKSYNALIRFSLATLLAVLISRVSADSIEAYFYDLRIWLKPPVATSGAVEMVLFDPTTMAQLPGLPKAAAHLKVAQQILESEPLAIVYTFDVSKVEGSSDEKSALAELLKNQIFVIADEDPDFTSVGKEKLNNPFKETAISPAPFTRDNKFGGKDGVTRRQMLYYHNTWMLHQMLAAKINPEVNDLSKIRGHFELYQAEQTNVDFHRKGSFQTSKFENIFNHAMDTTRFKGKIVLIGDDLNEDSKRYILTPYDRSVNAMTLTEMHANMIDTLIRNSAPVKAPAWVNLLFTILISVLTVHVVLTVKPGRGILILLTTAAIFVFACYIAFWPFGVLIGMIHPMLAIFLCYYFFIPYRLIIENRRSWEYFQKHKLLSEVETLKTNFIGMMSHDLKTPLARIQGMTEIIARGTTPLSAPQSEALDTVKQSAEDLTRFISTILNYAKIESQGVELHLQSCDINELVKDVVKKSEFLAKLKHIQLLAELEPLFTIRIDPELMKQVLSNLIENAIKYSPENSKVLVTTDEIEGKIVVQVADQGIGIPVDELPNIFMKFFRSNNAKSSPIKGSGLGLYLAKYFVELHQGTISCESSPGQGSTFTVELPLLN